MKRDMDLIRDILLALESNPELDGCSLYRGPVGDFFAKDGVDDDEAAYQLLLLIDRDFVVGSYDRSSGTFDVERLSMDGHDFLDTIRDDEVWTKTKETARKAGTGAIEFVWGIAKEIAKAEIKRRTGFDVG